MRRADQDRAVLWVSFPDLSFQPRSSRASSVCPTVIVALPVSFTTRSTRLPSTNRELGVGDSEVCVLATDDDLPQHLE